jgi:hypothetical protein
MGTHWPVNAVYGEFRIWRQRSDLTQRPDIVLHVPAEESRAEIDENNFAVWALKRHASNARALSDFKKLDEMLGRLHLAYLSI